jgi:hypothetical protein
MSSFSTPPPSSTKSKLSLSKLNNDSFNIDNCRITHLPSHIKSSWIKNREPIAMVIDNVLSELECKEWIEKSELIGYEEALVNVGGGDQLKMTDIRNSSRCIIDDIERASEIWNRIKHFIPTDYIPPIENCIPTEVNERLRFLRYDIGEYFKPHFDGCYQRDTIENDPKYGDVSFLTIQIYLNDGFEGGSTRFFSNTLDSDTDYYDVVPKTGSVLIFDHRMLHSGEVLIKGRKYALRSDIMFTPKL